MSEWSLHDLFSSLHADVERRLTEARKVLAHAVAKGDASEEIWLTLLNEYLPARYKAISAFVVDSEGAFSDQIDVVICDRQYSPIVFKFGASTIVPAESVYAVFEAKQHIDAKMIEYAQKKAQSVRKLVRTSLSIKHVAGVADAVEPQQIISGILSLDSAWTPALGEPLRHALTTKNPERFLDIGCVASHGIFSRKLTGEYDVLVGGHPATAFLFELIARLQELGTVPRLDVRAYARWLKPGG